MTSRLLRLRVLLPGLFALLGSAAALLAVADWPLDVEALRRAARLPDIPATLPAARPPAGLDFSVIETGHSAGTLEAFVVAGGRWLGLRHPVHMAVLVRHPQGNFLFDLGLGREVGRQFAVNGPLDRLLFGYTGADPAADQLARAGLGALPLAFAVPSHLHWDHVSALPDFPALPVLVQPVERAGALHGAPPNFLQSQFADHRHWRELRFDGGPHLGFTASHDLFGDGAAVLVPLGGHTAGQVGLFLTLPSGRRYLFSGDVTWTTAGIVTPADRSWLTRHVAHLDHDEAQNQAAIVQLHRLQRAHPSLLIVPAHDERLLRERLPRFPDFQS